ncbi:MAG: hypothetical protein GDA45_03375 [Chromatiales bacterium]|nr:hypothetical protein [Chromatiales bacterium]
MQKDMHFWGTYVITRAAGVPMNDAHTIAYAAQYVDDSTQQDSEQHEDGGLLYGIATAHHALKSAANSVIDREAQRRVWVPFHFIPGGMGKTLAEKLLCVKDSEIAQEMITHHIAKAKEKTFALELIGIAAHVYMDTFSHYGFSGISSEYNAVKADSFKFFNVESGSRIEKYIKGKHSAFVEKYKEQIEQVHNFFAGIKSSVAEAGSGALGHAGVVTYPDRPFLHWQVEFERARADKLSNRNNPQTYLEGCEKLHGYLSEFARERYEQPEIVPFENIKGEVEKIIQFQGAKEERIDKWKQAITERTVYAPEEGEAKETKYEASLWEEEKEGFHNATSSSEGIDTNVYRFHQAAAFHRYYVLKDLLPKHNIAVY